MRRILAAFASLLISPAFAQEQPPKVIAVEVPGTVPAGTGRGGHESNVVAVFGQTADNRGSGFQSAIWV